MDRLDELRLFLAIVDSGSFAAGGRQLGRSPSSASRILGELESRLGLRLLQRSTRRLALTDGGSRLAEQARRLLADFDEAMAEAQGEKSALNGRLRLSAPTFFGRRHLAPLIADFLDLHPAIAAELSLEDRMVDLIEERIDVALRIGELDTSSLIARRVGEVRRIVVASPAYLAAHGTPRRPEDLARHTAILFVNQANGPVWTFHHKGRSGPSVRVRGRLQINRAEAAIELAAAGKGVVRALSYQVAPELRARRVVRVLRGFEPPALPVQLVYPSARQLAPRVRAFIDFAAARLARLPELGARA